MSREENISAAINKLSENIPGNIPSIVVLNKIDLVNLPPALKQEDKKSFIYVSIKKQFGIDLLIAELKNKAGYQTATEGNFIARRRHVDALNRALQCLHKGIEQLEIYRAGELLAEELRLAQEALSSITGRFTPDDLLGEIFSSFCIGK